MTQKTSAHRCAAPGDEAVWHSATTAPHTAILLAAVAAAAADTKGGKFIGQQVAAARSGCLTDVRLQVTIMGPCMMRNVQLDRCVSEQSSHHKPRAFAAKDATTSTRDTLILKES
jgi:hypothetical protein